MRESNQLPTELMHLTVNQWVQSSDKQRTGLATDLLTGLTYRVKFRTSWPRLGASVEVFGEWKPFRVIDHIFAADYWRAINTKPQQTVAGNLHSLARLHG